jgi:membrane-bound lytic murein transglycosylase B
MNRWPALALVTLCFFAVAAPRWTESTTAPKRAKISIYQVAPGRHLDFLKWLAAREDVARSAGVPATQLYAHLDGAAWDYLVIWPITTPEQDKKLDDQAAAKGLKIGFPAALEFRELLASHTDTYAEGPTTAAALVAAAR